MGISRLTLLTRWFSRLLLRTTESGQGPGTLLFARHCECLVMCTCENNRIRPKGQLLSPLKEKEALSRERSVDPRIQMCGGESSNLHTSPEFLRKVQLYFKMPTPRTTGVQEKALGTNSRVSKPSPGGLKTGFFQNLFFECDFGLGKKCATSQTPKFKNNIW